MQLHYRAGETVLSVRIERKGEHFVVQIGDRRREVVVRRAADGALDLLVDGRPLRAFVAAADDLRAVKPGDRDAVLLERVDAGAGLRETGARGAGAASGDRPPARLQEEVTAGMDGQIAAVLVKPGDLVEAGATLLILEAMKMEMRLVAPQRARVRDVACREGDVVRRGRLLVQLEAA